MMEFNFENSKYSISVTSKFKKNYKKVIKQGKDKSKLVAIVEKLANGEKLEEKYKDHNLVKDSNYDNCRECHIEPDWLLIYQIQNDRLILLLISTGSHSELFK